MQPENEESIQANTERPAPTEVKSLLDDVASSANDLTILARLELTRNLVFDGGGLAEDNGRGGPPTLRLAYQLLSDVIEVLETYPAAGQLRRAGEPIPEHLRTLEPVNSPARALHKFKLAHQPNTGKTPAP